MRREKSRMRGVYHWNRLPRSVIESNFNAIPALSRGLNCKLLSQEPSKWNHSLIRHMPFVNLGSHIYVKELTEKYMRFHNLLSSFCRMTGNICVCGAVLKLLYRYLLNLTKKDPKKCAFHHEKQIGQICTSVLRWTSRPIYNWQLYLLHFLPLMKSSCNILPKPPLKIFPWKGISQQLQHPVASRGVTRWEKWNSILEQGGMAASFF